ncbi:uncharacterized protein E5676_scaffold306G002250 [Cucumis melo var. makuwa]|uniref:Uncharacterized protein n=1 Tax=Cucumis melo var. makuwa TaxID=1194695 RepID=A0A5A7TFL2_CUCMM|nr:uncharacterized protein E6C27_scaffold67G004350 [Cucumis melo var. makuwa]TYK17928.1 uncharacterized protein E5676_scaffold306G002250 [Cucumis melo var. makuwa]
MHGIVIGQPFADMEVGTSSDPFYIEGTSSNPFSKDNEMLGMLHDLQAPIEYEEEMAEEGLENDMSSNSGVEHKTMNIFQELLNQAHFLSYEAKQKLHDLGMGYKTIHAYPQNVWLGLASDGFNLFGHMSTTNSMWPMVLSPYNLSPWKCMKVSNFFISLQLVHLIANTRSKIS